MFQLLQLNNVWTVLVESDIFCDLSNFQVDVVVDIYSLQFLSRIVIIRFNQFIYFLKKSKFAFINGIIS